VSAFITYPNTPLWAEKIGWARLEEHWIGDTGAPYVLHNHILGKFIFTVEAGTSPAPRVTLVEAEKIYATALVEMMREVWDTEQSTRAAFDYDFAQFVCAIEGEAVAAGNLNVFDAMRDLVLRYLED